MLIFLAALESTSDHAIAAAMAGVPHVLTSYFYAGYRNKSVRVEWIHALKQAKVRFIDSGAFTLRTSVLNLVTTTGNAEGANVDYDHYLHSYASWLKRLAPAGLADVWVEMDIGAVTGHDWVDKHRAKLIGAGLGHGLINVWHSEHDWLYWLYLLREAKRPGRSGYVAIEGHQIGRSPLDYRRFLHEAYRRGVKVHGFRMTTAEDLRRWPFYSVDSSSWIAPVRNGTYPIVIRAGGVQHTRRRNVKSGERSVWMGPISNNGTTSTWRKNILTESARAWVTAERQLDAMWRARGVDWDQAISQPEVVDGAT